MRKGLFFIFAITLISASTAIAGNFNSGSTGADGTFNPASNIEVVLPENGILNYTTVNIPAGVTVTFKKNAANTPVYILATGDVTIAGTINVDGGSTTTRSPGKGGHGGYDGGLGASSTGMAGGKGLGPGGGNPGGTGADGGSGGGGGFGTNGNDGAGTLKGTGGGTYANEKILPLIGGSGGGGGNYTSGGAGGGGGGGAILIASSGTINVVGTITANGGNAPIGNVVVSGGGGGSGGAIKLMADTISGNGTISAMGGNGGIYGWYPGGSGGVGRIRLEAFTVTRTAVTTPSYIYGYPNTVFVANEPTLTITSIGGVSVPSNPSGTYGTPDVILPSTITNPIMIDIAATNIPVGTQVTITAIPEYGTSTSTTGTLSGTDASSTASVSITLPTTYQSILTAKATFTIQTAMYYEGEKIEKVMVASTIGKGSEVTYISESGKEISARELIAKVIGEVNPPFSKGR
jgi:hypothetical protein